jgi:integrase
VQEALPWADQHGLHGHDLRRTGSSWIERRFGRGVAKAWLGHADDVTGGYTRGTAEEIRAATDWLGSVVFGTSA